MLYNNRVFYLFKDTLSSLFHIIACKKNTILNDELEVCKVSDSESFYLRIRGKLHVL
jgi:hypothetical protein